LMLLVDVSIKERLIVGKKSQTPAQLNGES
jgi:hypothetical protein